MQAHHVHAVSRPFEPACCLPCTNPCPENQLVLEYRLRHLQIPRPKRPKVPMSVGFRRHQNLQAEIHHKRQKLSLLTQSVTNFKTQNSKQEFEIWKLEDHVADLKKELEQEKLNIDHLKGFERESFASLRQKFELCQNEISAEIDRGLLEMKDALAQEIHLSMDKARQKAAEERKELQALIHEASARLQHEKSDLNRTLIGLKEDHHRKVLRLQDDAKNAAHQLRLECVRTRATIQALVGDLDAASHEVHNKNIELARVQGRLAEQENTLMSRQAVLQELHKDHQRQLDQYEQVGKAMEAQEAEIQKLQARTQKMTQSFPALEAQRRVMHEQVQNLKGNIRVFCRIRPADGDAPMSDMSVSEMFSCRGKQELTLKAPVPGISSRTPTHHFHFDKVFLNSPNSDIFLEISQLVQSSLDGHNVCVFAYGQTGSGKTFTMSHENDGMIPLAVDKIFGDISALSSQGWLYTVEGRFLEIYNEQMLDLLPGLQQTAKYEIKHDDAAGKTSVTNTTSVVFRSAQHCRETLEVATKKRSTASTMANTRSSRSHFVFTLDISGRHQTGKTCTGTLNLVDLAGSERLNSLQAKGDRLKETQAINKSLACLGDVIMSLNKPSSQARGHVPYRNSKLTYYLKHSLGGNSKTLMFVNVSPLAQNTSETLNSLRFAAKVNETKMGSPEERSPR